MCAQKDLNLCFHPMADALDMEGRMRQRFAKGVSEEKK